MTARLFLRLWFNISHKMNSVPPPGPSTFVFCSLGGHGVVTAPGFTPALFRGTHFSHQRTSPPLTSALLCHHKQEVGKCSPRNIKENATGTGIKPANCRDDKRERTAALSQSLLFYCQWDIENMLSRWAFVPDTLRRRTIDYLLQ